METVFIFAVVWSLGCTGDGESRRKFDTMLRSLLAGITPEGYADYLAPGTRVSLSVPVPSASHGATVYDYAIAKRSTGKGLAPGRWQLWTDTIPQLDIPADSQFADIIIPTKDSARCGGPTLLPSPQHSSCSLKALCIAQGNDACTKTPY